RARPARGPCRGAGRGSPRWCRRPPTWRSSHTRSCPAGSRAAGTPGRSRSGSRTRSRSRSRAGHGPARQGPGRPRRGRPARRTGPARSAPTGHPTGQWHTGDAAVPWHLPLSRDDRKLRDLAGKDFPARRQTGITWDQMPSESARGPATMEIDPPPWPSGDRIAASVKAMRQATRLTTGSILADTLLERARHGFAASHDYDGDAQVAADFVTHLLVAFVFSRTGLGENEVPYLYDPEADEPMLARDLQDFVAASGQPPSFMGGLI